MDFQRFPFVIVTILLMATACSKKEDTPDRIAPEPFRIKSISKDKGMGGDILEISGSGFGTDASAIDVRFAISSPPVETLIGDIVSAMPNRLAVRVPYIYTTDIISVYVSGGGRISNKVTFACDIDAVDSVAVVKSEWTTTTIKEGFVWKTASVEAFRSKQNINVVEIDQSKATEMGLLYSTPVGTRKRTSVFAKQADATVAINGSYYSGGKASIGHLRVNGVDVEDGEDWKGRINASLTINNDMLSIHYLGTSRYNETSKELTGKHVMACGPSLLVEGIYVKTVRPDDGHVLLRHPRTAVGVTANNKTLLLVTVDGRQRGFSDGVNLRELSVIMRALKAKNAMNLDGGGSTTLYIKDYGVVNKISDASERSIANILFVK